MPTRSSAIDPPPAGMPVGDAPAAPASGAPDKPDKVAKDFAIWLLREGSRMPGMRVVLGELVQRLLAEGLPLSRVALGELTLHPEARAYALRWRKGDAAVSEEAVGHHVARTDDYLGSPFQALYEGEDEIRRRLDGDAALDFALLRELREQGHTDYLALALSYGSGQRAPLALCTDRPGGFSEDEIARLRTLVPPLGLIAELHAVRRLPRALLETYLGSDAARQVLDGHIQRGDASTLNAVIWYCDLRGFTAMSDRMPPHLLVKVLNDYFEAMAGALVPMGGEILKFIGDGMLAVFRIGPDDRPAEVCEHALNAARLALAAMRRRNRRRRRASKPLLEFSLALHVGEVMYGNIGAPGRLDFTVIGPAVNLTARLEGLAGQHGLPLVTSAAFAAQCPPDNLRSFGHHALRGVAGEQEVFVPA